MVDNTNSRRKEMEVNVHFLRSNKAVQGVESVKQTLKLMLALPSKTRDKVRATSERGGLSDDDYPKSEFEVLSKR